ncbi:MULTISPECIES: helix-turn-helix transcriptional regulator [unclassified Roseateles]|uniref:helix-turn-helix transcriptional regulator n=1 Tax=unclassified Roseateles TaxID=2626991 RepID=UPI00148505BF|nr:MULTISPECIES: LuxR C-terminal-related transcriptional regulator [unclassified Roseateles]MCZ7881708.1 LuxR C-terminal-related transcriptional regulator [Paucibacter sp. M5-1]MDC6170967.1 LuxR C-terminal-related transcriptional regulator [Paucibacter sp. XJ19-41]
MNAIDLATVSAVSTVSRSTAVPERRRAASLSSHWLGLVLEELDYGVLLLNQRGELLHSNRAARLAMDARHPLQLLGGQLRARCAKDVKPLFEALAHAEREGRRCLLRLGEGAEQANVVVVPLNRDVEQAAVLLVLERRELCGALAAQWFALRYGLTPAETEVLKALSDGAEPSSVAQAQGVAISTVRTQIQSIRAKSGAPSIRELLRQLAVLPPLMSALYN